jgi:hypothetical protein
MNNNDPEVENCGFEIRRAVESRQSIPCGSWWQPMVICLNRRGAARGTGYFAASNTV